MNKAILDVERSADGWPQSFDPHAEGGQIRLANGRVYFVAESGAWIRKHDLEPGLKDWRRRRAMAANGRA